MAVPNEGTSVLPSDGGGRFFAGYYNPVDGFFYAPRTPTVFKQVALAAGTAETTIWTPTAGKKFRLLGLLLTAGAGTLLTFRDNTAGTLIFYTYAAANAPLLIPAGALGNGLLSGAANRVLTVTRGTSATLDGMLFGTEE